MHAMHTYCSATMRPHFIAVLLLPLEILAVAPAANRLTKRSSLSKLAEFGNDAPAADTNYGGSYEVSAETTSRSNSPLAQTNAYQTQKQQKRALAAKDHQIRLIRDLLDNKHFDHRARPIRNDESRPVNVTIRLSLYQLIQVDEPRESVVLNVWMTQTWQDEYLTWNPEEYGNISWVVVPVESVWRPDTTLYNGLDMQTENSERWICIELSMLSTDPLRAHVRFAFPALYRFSCSMDVLYFPFDKQNCTLLFGSWVYDAMYIDFYPESEDVNLEAFIQNEEWTLISFKGYRHVNKYSCCPNPYTIVTYHFVIKRKPLYFICNLVIPIVIITLISFVGFFMPSSTNSDRGEKVSLGITTLLAMSILLLMVADQMPTTSTFVPLMGWFFLTIIVQISVASVLTAVIINVQRGGRFGRKISRRTRRIFFVYVPQFIFMKIPRHLVLSAGSGATDTLAEEREKDTHETLILPNAKELSENGRSMSSGLARLDKLTSQTYLDVVDDSIVATRAGRSNSPNPTLSEKVDIIRRHLCKLQQIMMEKEPQLMKDYPDDWEILANVIERVCLIIFTFALITFTGAILFIGFLAEQ